MKARPIHLFFALCTMTAPLAAVAEAPHTAPNAPVTDFLRHAHGVCRMEGDRFTHFTEDDGVQGPEVWDLYMDSAGDVWFPVEG